MNIDEEIGDFLQSERRLFETRKKEVSLSLKEKENKKGKKRISSRKTMQEELKGKWKEGRKEIKIACHNINELKTKGWKLKVCSAGQKKKKS